MIKESEKRRIALMTPGQRDAEIIDHISDVNIEGSARATSQPRQVTFTDAYAPLANVVCVGVILYNDTGKTVKVKRGGGSIDINLASGMGKQFDVVNNANELSVANGTDAASVTMTYELLGETL